MALQPKKIINVKDVGDKLLQDNFDAIRAFINRSIVLSTYWKMFDISYAAAVTADIRPHGLDFIPTDIIQTYKTGAGSITFNYDSFTSTNMSITTTGACRVRFLIGKILTTESGII